VVVKWSFYFAFFSVFFLSSSINRFSLRSIFSSPVCSGVGGGIFLRNSLSSFLCFLCSSGDSFVNFSAAPSPNRTKMDCLKTLVFKMRKTDALSPSHCRLRCYFLAFPLSFGLTSSMATPQHIKSHGVQPHDSVTMTVAPHSGHL